MRHKRKCALLLILIGGGMLLILFLPTQILWLITALVLIIVGLRICRCS